MNFKREGWRKNYKNNRPNGLSLIVWTKEFNLAQAFDRMSNHHLGREEDDNSSGMNFCFIPIERAHFSL